MRAAAPFSTTLIVRITLCGLLFCILLTGPLWVFSARTFPLLPIWGEANLSQGYFQPLLTLVIIGLLLWSIFRPWNKAVWLALLMALGVAIGFDLNRLQPWLWYAMLVLFVLLFHTSEDHKKAAFSVRWLLAAVYFWGGFNKITPYFAEDNFAWFCDAFPATHFLGKYVFLGYGVAFFEMALGLLLLWAPPWPGIKWLYIAFHAIIIVFLGKAQWNYVVLPWNISMAATVFVLWYFRPEQPDFPDRFTVKTMIVSVFIWITPLLGIFHYWPYQLSWQLYSNTQSEAVFYSLKPCNKTGPIWAEKAFDEGRRLLLDDWAFADLGTPMFYSDRTFRQMGRYLCDCITDTDSTKLLLLSVEPWDRDAEQSIRISCQDLKIK